MQYVFSTTECKRYVFPTHCNELVVDRADAVMSEVFLVTVEPGKAVHFHRHCDMEQIFYFLAGRGILTIGGKKKEFKVVPGHVARIPPGTLHSVRPAGKRAVQYLSVDCFCSGKKSETTWDKHVRNVCREKGYSYDSVVSAVNK
jgi:mannose-6-phosphate isomerase-like protein (cupin superfamily)